ncbi:phage major capsid protein [Acinetobacter guillouiae]|uniref:phage major capsid protein n=1 Tax=Acinetobacter guillouiae TaxID=106649 RepID=UPI003D053A09
MKLAEQIAKLKANIKSHQDQIVVKSGDSISKGVTPDEAVEAEIKQLQDEIDVMQKNLERLENIEKAQMLNLTPVAGQTSEQGVKTTQGIVTTEPVLAKGMGVALLVRAKLASQQLMKNHSEFISASDLLKSWNVPQHIIDVAKAVPGTTTSPDYQSLVTLQNLTSEFVDILRPQTIIGKMKGFRNVPFNISIPTKTQGSIVNWVGETKKKPVTGLKFGQVKLGFAKIAGIIPFSDELGRFSDPSIDQMVFNDLSDSIIEFMDGQFIDPAKAESAESPASILKDAPKIVASGITADAIRSDLRKLRGELIKKNVSLTGCYYVMSETMASFMSDLIDALGNPIYRGMDAPTGEKTLKGLPVVESEKAGKLIALVKPSEILLADDGGVDLAISTEATLEYNDGTDDIRLGLFQQNMVAVRAERYVNWKQRNLASAYIDYTAQTIE